jgi:hypothetical protein
MTCRTAHQYCLVTVKTLFQSNHPARQVAHSAGPPLKIQFSQRLLAANEAIDTPPSIAYVQTPIRCQASPPPGPVEA